MPRNKKYFLNNLFTDKYSFIELISLTPAGSNGSQQFQSRRVIGLQLEPISEAKVDFLEDLPADLLIQ